MNASVRCSPDLCLTTVDCCVNLYEKHISFTSIYRRPHLGMEKDMNARYNGFLFKRVIGVRSPSQCVDIQIYVTARSWLC